MGTLGVGDGQGGLECCDSWGHKESDTTEWLNWLTDWPTPCLFHSLSWFVIILLACLPVCLLPLPSQLDWQLYEGDYHIYLLQDYIPVPGIQKVLPKQISMLILVKWKNQHSRWEFPGGSVVRTLAPLQGTGVPSLVREPRSHNLWGAAKKKKKGKKTTTKKHSQGIMRCLLSQEKRCTVNVSKNSNETWCLSIPLHCKVLNAGIFVLIPSCHNYRPIAPSDTTPPLFNPMW